MGPTKSPEKDLFPEFPKGNLTLGGVRFPGANPSGKLALRWFPPIFSQHQAAFLGHRWRNSFFNPPVFFLAFE